MRRQQQIEEEWHDMEKGREGNPLTVEDIPRLLERLDYNWNLEGNFVDKMPTDFNGVLKLPAGEVEVLFIDFWQWFEGYVKCHDVLRAEAFEEAARRRIEGEYRLRKAQEESARREKAIQEVLELRRSLEDQFDTVSADMYCNYEVNRILNKGAIMQGVEERSDGPPFTGEHVALIIGMLQLWGCPVVADDEGDEWNVEALGAWKQWLEEHGPLGTAHNRVDSMSLKGLMDRDNFQEYLIRTYPVRSDVDGSEIKRTAEIKGILQENEDSLDIIVEAIDEETGDMLKLSISEHQVEEVRRRLEGSEPLLAKVDLVSNRITDLLSAPVVEVAPDAPDENAVA